MNETAVRTPVIAVVGNPNTGKTTLFNQLCGARQKVGNYPGVTIARKQGNLRLESGRVELVDLPGAYSLKADSYDEQVVVDDLQGRVPGIDNRPDLVLFVMDATNIKRNLYLFSQVAETGLPMVVALTMTDLLEKNGINLDEQKLEGRLGVPVISTGQSANGAKNGHARLLDALDAALKSQPLPRTGSRFPAELEKIVAGLHTVLDKHVSLSPFEARNLIFYTRDPLNERFADNPDALAALAAARERARALKFTAPSVMAVARYNWADSVVSAVETREPPAKSLSEKIDAFMTHRVLGLAAFVGVMFTVFYSLYFLADPLMGTIEDTFGFIGDSISPLLATTPILESLVKDGIVGGVGSVVVFLPQIIILFIFIAVLEDSGYLARASFLMDKLLSWTGLNGRAFIPMLSSFACAVPGVMSARVMTDTRARLTTVLTAPLMSCSARLPVYVLMIGAFIQPVYGAAAAGLALFFMHAVGVLVAMPIAWILNRGVLKTPTIPFIMELPPYRRPSLRNVYHRVSQAAWKFIVRAGTTIFALTVIIWALTYFPRDPAVAKPIELEYNGKIDVVKANTKADDAKAKAALAKQVKALEAERDNRIASTYLEQSYLGRMGKTIQPVFAPLGYDWKITVGILAAFPARGVIIATLGIIYTVGDADETSTDLREKMRREKHPDGTAIFTPLTAVSIMVFFALCCQCLSTVVTVQRELNSWPWAIFMFTYMTMLAYVASLVVYQGGRMLGFQ